MQNGADIYPNFDVSSTWFVLAVTILFVVVFVKVFGAKILKRLAMHKQAKEIAISKKQYRRSIDQAIAQLEQIRSSYLAGQKTATDAAYEMSVLVRGTFDQIMQHRTMYQARYELTLRNLTALAAMLEGSYPPEFSANSIQAVPLDAAVFDQARGVLESCR